MYSQFSRKISGYCEQPLKSLLQPQTLHYTLSSRTPRMLIQLSIRPLFDQFVTKFYVLFYFYFQSSEATLPVCSPNSVCNKVDTYGSPWVEKQCKCPGKTECSTSTHNKDGHTVVDRNRQYKVLTLARPELKYSQGPFINYVTLFWIFDHLPPLLNAFMHMSLVPLCNTWANPLFALHNLWASYNEDVL